MVRFSCACAEFRLSFIRREYDMTRYATVTVLVCFCIVYCTSQLHAGQYSDYKRRIAAEIEKSKNIKLPTTGRPLPAGLGPDWKQKVYDGVVRNLKERERKTHHYLFLDSPTPCTVTQARMFKFLGKPKVTTGLGGLLAVRRDGRILDSYELLFYLLDAEGDVQLTIWHEAFHSYTIEPKLYEFVRLKESTSGFLPLVPPLMILKMAAFRKANIKELPPFE